MTGKRAVAFIDILGFKSLLANESISTVAEKYSRIIDMTEAFNRDLLPGHKEPSLFSSPSGPQGWCKKRIFSDSIILVAHEDTQESCLRLLIYVWKLMQACLSMGMPFRGGGEGDALQKFSNSI